MLRLVVVIKRRPVANSCSFAERKPLPGPLPRMAACACTQRTVYVSHPLVRRAARFERLTVAASGSGGDDGRTAAPARRGGGQQQLLTALAEQAAREAWGGWLGDLVLPLVSAADGAKAPPPLAVPQRELADPDSVFVSVEGVELHYKEALPAQTGMASSSSSSSGSSSSDGGNDAPAAAAAGGCGGCGGGPSAQRPTLLLVHGLNGSTFNWRHTLQPLADATGCR